MLEFFDNSDLKISDEQATEYSFLVLSDLGQRSVAIESLLFAYNHLKYMKNRVSVSLISHLLFDFYQSLAQSPEQKMNVENCYQNFEKFLPELKTYIYACFMPNILKVYL